MTNERTYAGRRTTRHLKAVIAGDAMNARNMVPDKELVKAWSVVVIYKDKILEPVTIRWYSARTKCASVTHCSVWIHGTGAQNTAPVSVSGYGRDETVGGDRLSAALAEALESAGVTLYGSPYRRRQDEHAIDYRKEAHIHGVGEEAMREACYALAEAMGYRADMMIVQH